MGQLFHTETDKGKNNEEEKRLKMNVKLMLFLILSVFAVLPGTIFGLQFIDKFGKAVGQRSPFLPESVAQLMP